MKFASDDMNMVVAGSWNPAILTPEWVIKNGLGKDPTGQTIQLEFPVLQGGDNSPKYTVDSLTFVARRDALILVPKDATEESCKLIDHVATSILTNLKHTPITAFGYNLSLHCDTPDAAKLETFKDAQTDLVTVVDDTFEVKSTAVASVLTKGELTVTVNRTFEGGTVGIKFNFQYDVKSSSDAVEKLSKSASFFACHEMAHEILADLYGDEDEDAEDVEQQDGAGNSAAGAG